MRPFAEIESKAAELICSNCGTSSISIALRCDYTDRECLPVATCRECGRTYDAEILSTHQEKHLAIRQLAESEPCANCRARERTVKSLCDRAARRCFFLVACDLCGDTQLA